MGVGSGERKSEYGSLRFTIERESIGDIDRGGGVKQLVIQGDIDLLRVPGTDSHGGCMRTDQEYGGLGAG